MNIPTDMKLYEQVKNEIFLKYPKHSAYRSGLLVKTYKEKFQQKHGNKEPYNGKEKQTQGLNRWFKEEWKNQRGEVGYQSQGDIYRPSKRITKDTPKTLNELSKKDIQQAMIEKRTTGRVKRF